MPASTPNIAGITHAGDRLAARLDAAAPICVGLDPVAERMPEAFRNLAPLEAIGAFCDGVLGAISGMVPCVKIQSACFERYGASGVALLEQVINTASGNGFEVILDNKRGDIGITAEHYAAAALGAGAHWVTLNGYLGEDAIRPFLDADLGVFVLVRTSNPSANHLQSTATADGGTIASKVAEMVSGLGADCTGERGISSVGAVVGANKTDDARSLREIMPDQPFLLPGYGAQGGGADGVQAALRPDRRGVLVTASRSVIYAEVEGDEAWTDAVHRAARAFADDVRDAVNGSEA
ncbi:MAG: orotidine-5'-phosphate decarboxylase [Phycisphaerales bacterium]|nr:orotidine-5'-phosphate decarboxylase [Phycisphaerales bacterium]